MPGIDDTPILHCPWPQCGEVMLYDRRHQFWQCPRCGAEVWKDSAKLAHLEEEATEAAIEAYRRRRAEKERQGLLWSLGNAPAQPLSCGYVNSRDAKKGHSRSSSKRRRKKRPKRQRRERFAAFL